MRIRGIAPIVVGIAAAAAFHQLGNYLAGIALRSQTASRSDLSEEEARRVRMGLGINLGEECRVTHVGYQHALDTYLYCKLVAPANSPSLQALVNDAEHRTVREEWMYVPPVFCTKRPFDWFYLEENEVQYSLNMELMHEIVIGKERQDGQVDVLVFAAPAQKLKDQTALLIAQERADAQ